MKFISIDIETTGLNPKTDTILEFGAVAVDTTADTPILGTFRALFMHKYVNGNPIALSMNSMLLMEIAAMLKVKDFDYNVHNKHNPSNVFVRTAEEFEELFSWWKQSIGVAGRLNLAGKNLAFFDIPFLTSYGINMHHRHRVLDPGILYIKEGDEVIPDLQECINRSKLPNKNVTHTAVDDAMDVALLLLEKLKC